MSREMSRKLGAALTAIVLLVVLLATGNSPVFWICLAAAVTVGAVCDYRLK